MKSHGIKLLDEQIMKSLKEENSYKYLGILEADDTKHGQMKEKIKKEYLRRVRKIMETKLNGKNVIKEINTWAVALLRYSAAFLQ